MKKCKYIAKFNIIKKREKEKVPIEKVNEDEIKSAFIKRIVFLVLLKITFIK